MWRFLCMPLLVLLTVSTGFAEVTINVQPFPPNAELKPGVSAVLTVDGLEPDQETAWHRIPRVEGDLVLSFSDEQGRPVLLFTGSVSGRRTFLLQLGKPGLDELVQCDFAYGDSPSPGPEPEPEPEPNPTPPPPVPGVRIVIGITESGDQTTDQVKVLENLGKYLETKKHRFRFLDPDHKDPRTETTPTWLVPYLQEVRRRSVDLPALVIVAPRSESGLDGSVLAVEPLPNSLDKAVDLIKRYGG